MNFKFGRCEEPDSPSSKGANRWLAQVGRAPSGAGVKRGLSCHLGGFLGLPLLCNIISLIWQVCNSV